MAVVKEEKPLRSLAEIEADRQRVKARLHAEGKDNIAWHEDYELLQLVLEIFSHYRHEWLPTRKGGKVMKALCLGIEQRGGVPDESNKPPCPGCRKVMKGEF